ncbi:hypothetical protein ACH4FX_42835 [Streptomyces sp. NPDC018019]|uniref:hypothetical protein n=1 Tax=Streptomyces sp. NPDC018019 TaxID=3365030 RepID=UPI0037BB033C
MEPLTEHRPVSGPIVFGFLRLPKATAARRAALTNALEDYCRSHELVLSSVFTECAGSSDALSAAFTGLLDALALPMAYGVVVPAASHLGPRPIAAERRRQITGSVGRRRLLIVRGGTPSGRAGIPGRTRHREHEPVRGSTT